jgi:hypothetical protein
MMRRCGQLFAVVGVVAAAVVGVLLLSAASDAGGASRPMVLVRALRGAEAYAAGDRLWVTQQTYLHESGVANDEIMRVDPTSGRVLAIRLLGKAYRQALLSRRVLWVTTTAGRSVWLWRLDPDSLRVISKSLLPGSVSGGLSFGEFGTLATAGGWLWVGGWNTLDRVSLTTGHTTFTLRVPDAQGVDVASNAAGTVLVDSEGHQRARVQRRDPHTGRLLTQTSFFDGVTKPQIGGVFGDGIWLTEATGMMGYAQRISVRTLRPIRLSGTPAHPGITGDLIEGSNGIDARVINKVLWVTQPAGATSDNYCGDAATGRRRSALHLGATEGELLAVGATDIYYEPGLAGGGMRPELVRARINQRC